MPIANTNAPMGFSLLRWGGTNPPKRMKRPVAAGRSKDLMVGDAYTVGISGAVLRVTAATDALHGIVEAIGLNAKSGSSQGPESQDYIPAADAGYIIGIEDPNALFKVMSTTFAVATDVGKTAAVVDADGNQALAQSRQSVVLDATGGHLQVKIVELYDSPADNSTGAFADVVVRLLETL